MAFYSSEAEDAETLGTTLRTVAAEVKGKVRGKQQLVRYRYSYWDRHRRAS